MARSRGRDPAPPTRASGACGTGTRRSATRSRRSHRHRRAGSSTLTPAELRLLPLLATHRSFREIGGQLHISRNTVKTQAISVYRKLGVSSRSDAIERAAGLGLLDG